MLGKESYRQLKQYQEPVTDGPIGPSNRSIAEKTLQHLLRVDVQLDGDGNGITQAEEFLENGFGLMIVYNHPSRKETVGMFKVPFSSNIMMQKRIAEPVALHQRQGWTDSVAKRLGIEFHYIITDDTVDYEWTHQHEYPPGVIRDYPAERKDLEKKALDREVEILGNGDIMMLALQGGRRPDLAVPERGTLGLYAAALKRSGVKAAVLPVGVGLEGVTDYTKASGYNFEKKLSLRVGHPKDLEVILKSAGGLRQADAFVINNMLASLVPEAYLNEFDPESLPNFSKLTTQD